MKRLFFGGVHPAAHAAKPAPAVPLPPPAQVVLPMQQHLGAPCQPVVAVGQRVLLGQVIGRGQGLCAPVHASVSGAVTAVEPRPHPSGHPCLSVVIANDGRDEKAPVHTENWQSADAETLIRAISDAGIVGMGGATFPTAAKLRSGLGRVDTVIVNACECEPYITADACMLAAQAADVLAGARQVARILAAQRLVVAVEDDKPAALKALRKLAGTAEIRVLPTRYPQGAEKQLIQSITQRQVPPGGLPADVGCAVLNAATCAAIDRALEAGTPLYERVVTVAGEGVARPQNFRVRLGTSFAALVEAAGGLLDGCERVLSGGPMMGVAQTRLDVPVLKGTNAIVCLMAAQLDHTEHPVCIRCGRCVRVCPMRLEPVYLHQFCVQNRPEALVRKHLTDCIDCGCCAYVCPGKLPLVAEFRAGKARLKARQQEGAQ